MTISSNRNGFALLLALMAVVIVTALMLATLLRTDQDTQIAHSETLTQRALAGAETALWEAATSADTRMLRSEPLGTVITSKASDDELTKNVTVIKIDTAIIWIVADAEVHKGGQQAHHRLGLSAIISTDITDSRLLPIPDRGLVELF